MNVKMKGSLWYKTGGVEPVDLMESTGILHDFAIGNIIKYATRCRSNLNRTSDMINSDLNKIIHYCEILINHNNKSSKGACDSNKTTVVVD